jgi:hypothetical protein
MTPSALRAIPAETTAAKAKDAKLPSFDGGPGVREHGFGQK